MLSVSRLYSNDNELIDEFDAFDGNRIGTQNQACPSACMILNKNSVAKEKTNSAVSNRNLIMHLDHLSCLQAKTIVVFLISGNIWAIV
jgi:hypothetical protein